MKNIILMISSFLFMLLIFVGCKQNTDIKDEEIIEYKVNYFSPNHADISCKMGEKDVLNGSTVKVNSILVFTLHPQKNYEADQWCIEGNTLTQGGNKEERTCTVKVTSDITITCSVKCLLQDGFDATTGNWVLDGIIFKMKDIPEAKDEVLGNEAEESDNKAHKVTLDAFAMGETEVTQELYEKVMGVNPSICKDEIEGENTEKKPVEYVTWTDCIAFCNRLTKMMPGLGDSYCVYYSDPELQNIYTIEDAKELIEPHPNWSRNGFRLPTSNEWEWAARGGAKDEYWAGTSDEKKVGDYAWIDTNSGHTTHEVAKKLPNGYGLYDMSGNVVERCWDWYQENIPTTPSINPTGPKTGDLKIARGGGAGIEFDSATVTHIINISPGHRIWFAGFRIMRKK